MIKSIINQSIRGKELILLFIVILLVPSRPPVCMYVLIFSSRLLNDRPTSDIRREYGYHSNCLVLLPSSLTWYVQMFREDTTLDLHMRIHTSPRERSGIPIPQRFVGISVHWNHVFSPHPSELSAISIWETIEIILPSATGICKYVLYVCERIL